MDSEIAGRVGEPSTRRTRPKPNRKSLAEPPLPPRSSQKKKKRRREVTPAKAYPAKRILAQKWEDGQLQYLIDWEDDPVTRKEYEPTWEPYGEVGSELVANWQQEVRTSPESPVGNIEQSYSVAPSQESEPVRPAKRRRTTQGPNLASREQPSPKKPRKAGTVQTARFQSVSQETVESQGAPSEIKDSYEEEEQLSSIEKENVGELCVEVPIPVNLDRDAYVTVASSQLSSNPHLSQYIEPSEQSLYAPSQSQFHTPTLHPRPSTFIWDEDLVPDSQEANSESYKPSETPTSKSGFTIRPNTEADLHFINSQWRSSRGEITDSGDVEGHFQEPLSYHARASYLQEELRNSSGRPETSVEAPSTDQQVETSWEDSRVSPQPESSYSGRVADESAQSVNLSVRPGTSHSNFSSEFQVSSVDRLESPALPGRRTWSEEAARILNQLQPRQPSQLVSQEGSELQFQSQVPLANNNEDYYEDGGQAVDDFEVESTDESRNHPQLLDQDSPLLGEQASRTLGPESQRQSSHQRTERSVSSFEATWLSSRVISSTPQSSSQRLAVAQTAAVPGFASQHLPRFLPGRDILSPELPKAPLSQPDARSQTAHPNSRDNSSPQKISPKFSSEKSSDYRPQQASGEVIPSIERIIQVSSSVPSRPSPPSSDLAQLPETYGSNLPSRPSPPSDSDMEDQVMIEGGEIDARQMLKQARANATAKRAAEQAAVRQASAAPSSLPSPPPAAVNQMLPLRETIADVPTFVAPPAPLPQLSPELEPTTRSLQVPPAGPNNFYVPLPINAYTRDIYNQVIINHKHQRLAILEDEEPDPSVVEGIELMIKDLELICDHPDLISQDFSSQRMVPEGAQAGYAENVSTKCIFLAEFLEAIRTFETHVAILVRPGRMLEILEALLRWHEYSYHRPDRPDFVSHNGRGPLKITLLPTGLGERQFSITPASIVIAFDRSFQGEKYANDLRVDPVDPKKLAPLISLTVTQSIEHLQLCLDKPIHRVYRLMKLVNCLKDIDDGVGILSHEYLPPPEAARAVVAFAVGETTDGLWPLLPMPEIDGISLALDTELESKQTQLSGSTTQSYNTSSPAPTLQSGFKRQLGSEDVTNPESSKRQRLTPVLGEPTAPIDVTRVSETVMNPSDNKPLPKSLEAEQIIAETDALDDQQDSQISSLLKRIADLETQIINKESTEASLRQLNQTLESQIQEYDRSIQQIQPKYQEALNDRGHFENEINLSLALETSIRRNLESRTNELAKIREEKAAVDAELVAARAALSGSSIPEVAELSRMKESLGATEKENERLQKRLGNLQSEIEYMRNSCQQANTAAAEAVNDLSEAQSEIASLTTKASSNTLRIHEIQHSSEIAQHISRIEELQTENKELEKELDKKNEELRTLLNGRRQTRGTSVPRSPRMGNVGTMSPRPIGRVMGIPVSGGSRGTSPAPGEVQRGVWTGEALFQGPQARWGTHLQ